jgi:LPXTG-site transpeptidase (sortase) family protein
MNSSLHKSSWLVIGGAILVLLAISNIFFNFTDTIQSYLTYQVSQYSHPNEVSISIEPTLVVPDTDKFKEGVVLGRSLIGMDNFMDLQTGTGKSAIAPVLESLKPEVTSYVPDRIVIPVIQLDAPIITSEVKSIQLKEQWFDQWIAPDEFAAGWQSDSAPLGMPGNTVINGHHNEYGKVFGHLINLQVGDIITVYSGQTSFNYKIADIQILKERDVSLAIRQENAKWISQTQDERITLVTCWPKRNNTHRLIVVAYPVATPN